MELHITSEQSIGEIQQAFRSRFPYLNIEFFRTPHQEGQGTPVQQMYDGQLRLRDIANKSIDTTLIISGTMSVAQTESLFNEKFGLSVQVFRRSGDQWLQTTTTDHRTLNEQNEKGKEMSEPFKEHHEPDDYQEQL